MMKKRSRCTINKVFPVVLPRQPSSGCYYLQGHDSKTAFFLKKKKSLYLRNGKFLNCPLRLKKSKTKNNNKLLSIVKRVS